MSLATVMAGFLGGLLIGGLIGVGAMAALTAARVEDLATRFGPARLPPDCPRPARPGEEE